jgi:hypothetical protein
MEPTELMVLQVLYSVLAGAVGPSRLQLEPIQLLLELMEQMNHLIRFFCNTAAAPQVRFSWN